MKLKCVATGIVIATLCATAVWGWDGGDGGFVIDDGKAVTRRFSWEEVKRAINKNEKADVTTLSEYISIGVMKSERSDSEDHGKLVGCIKISRYTDMIVCDAEVTDTKYTIEHNVFFSHGISHVYDYIVERKTGKRVNVCSVYYDSEAHKKYLIQHVNTRKSLFYHYANRPPETVEIEEFLVFMR